MKHEVIEYKDGAFCVRDFFSSEECDELIESSEAKGFDKSKIHTMNGEIYDLEIRNNDRVFFDDFDLAKRLFEKLEPVLPAEIEGWKVSGFNERFRFYRYSTQQYFKWHMDGSFKRDHSQRSKLSAIFYLNDDFNGGETDFAGFQVIPEKGMVLIFPHGLMHQGASVTKGCKYVFRTDVMYSR